MSGTVLFQPSITSRSGRSRLTRSLRVLESLRDNSIQAAEAVQSAANRITSKLRTSKIVSADDLEKLRICYHILNDVLRQQWCIAEVDRPARALQLASPEVTEKAALREIMAGRRQEAIDRDREWLDTHQSLITENLIDGSSLRPEKIEPFIEICETDIQHALFRYLRYTWSSPYSEYVGRRMRFLIRDRGNNNAIMGIAALGSSIMQIAVRDRWIGWMPQDDQERRARSHDHWSTMRSMRADKIVAMMDLYICGAIPPYSHLLGGKLICYMMMSNEVRKAFKRKYHNQFTVTRQRAAEDLVLLVTTSLYGNHSSQYNRVRYEDDLLYKPIGLTAGYGTVHLGEETFDLMRRFLARLGIEPSHKFGAGVNWKMRTVRTCLSQLGLDQDSMLQHSYPKAVYVAEYASNAREFLRGERKKAKYHNRPVDALVQYWRDRWLNMRLKNPDVLSRVRQFRKANLIIDTQQDGTRETC